MNKEQIIQAVADARFDKKYSRSELASACGLSSNFIRMFEKGGNISVGNLIKILDNLGLTISIINKQE